MPRDYMLMRITPCRCACLRKSARLCCCRLYAAAADIAALIIDYLMTRHAFARMLTPRARHALRDAPLCHDALRLRAKDAAIP